MKKLFIILIISFSFLFASFQNESALEKIDYLLENSDIKKVGLEKKDLYKIKDPFRKKSKPRVVSSVSKDGNSTVKKALSIEEELRVDGIFEDAVLVGGKWYKKGDSIYNKYRLFKIDGKMVTFKSKFTKRRYKLQLGEQNNEKIKINIF